MTKTLLIIFSAVLICSGCAPPKDSAVYKNWEKYKNDVAEATGKHITPISGLPMYGGKEKTRKQKLADKEFVDEVIQSTGSREKATLHILNGGWGFLSKGDYSTAMKRFNQAWLLSPNNAEVYWGFGVTLERQGNYDKSIKLFYRALKIDQKNPKILRDYSQVYIGKSIDKPDNEKNELLNKAIAIAREDIKINPDLGSAYFQWAIALYYKEEYNASWEKVKIASKLEKQCVNQEFVKELEKKLQHD